MKHRLQTLLKHKLQWLVLLTALLGVSQGVWGGTPVTIYMHNDADWSTCKIYYWEGECNSCPAWPGDDMEAVSEQSGWYKIDLDFTPGKIIFNNGSGTQTGDIELNPSKCYSNDNTSGSYETDCPCSTAGGTATAASSPIDYNTTTTISVSGYTPGATIADWEKSTTSSSSGFSSLSKTTSSITTESLTGTTYYRAKITEAGCSAYSSVATVNVNAPTTTIIVDVSAVSWSDNVKIYYWGAESSCSPYPGVDMDEVGSSLYQYSITSSTLSGFIISQGDGGQEHQTEDITDSPIGETNCYVVNNTWKTENDKRYTVTGPGDCPTLCTPPTKDQYTMASEQSVTYDGSAHAPTIGVASGAGGVTKIYGSTDNGTNWTDYGTTGPTNAGTYKIKVNVAAGDTYCAANDIELDNTYAITQKTPTASDFDFSNLAQTLPTTIVAVGVTPKSGITGMGSVTVKYGGSTELPTAAGTYAVTFDVAAGSNYSAATGLSAGSLVISKSNQTTPTVNNLASHCGIGDYTLSASNGESTGNYSYAIVSGGTGTATIEDNETETVTLSVTAVGTIIVKAKKLGDANYNESSYSSDKTFTIKSNSTASEYTIEDDYNEDYTGSAQTPDITIADGAGDISNYYYSSDNGSTWTAGTPTNAGEYKIKVDVAEGSSYCAADGIVITNTFTINKIDQAAFSIDNTVTTLAYCASAETQVTASGGTGEGAITFSKKSGTAAVTVSAAGLVKTNANASSSVVVLATKSGGTNYNDITAEKEFNFTQPAPTAYTLEAVGATAICGDPSSGAGSGTLRLEDSQTGYNYQLYSNDSPIEGYAAKAGTTDSSIDFPVTSSGTYTVYGYYGTNSANCPTLMDGEITLSISTQPHLVRSAASVTQYMPVTITSISTDIAEWKIVDGSGNDVSSSTAYLFDQTYDAISFKGASTDASTAKTYTIQAETSGGCKETTTVTVNPDTESCGGL